MSEAKRPAFQFYPADWLKDAELQSCSIGARGLWHELMCVMHECVPYGYLTVNGKAMTEAQAARRCGVEHREYRKLLAELDVAGVPSRDQNGVIYSRRMVRDENLRTIRANAGKLGGNPALVGHKDNKDKSAKVGGKVKQKPTPSSSSSSSSSPSETAKTLATAPAKAGNGAHGKPETIAPTTAVWERYAPAFRKRYGVEPDRPAETNGQLANLIKRVGQDAAGALVEFFLTLRDPKYEQQSHSIGMLLTNWHSISTRWKRSEAGVRERSALSSAGQQTADAAREWIEESERRDGTH